MAQYIDKSALVAEIERLREVQPSDAFQPKEQNKADWLAGKLFTITILETFLDNLEVKDPYEQCVQYDSIKASIQAHAETYSFNIGSELFNQLTKEQQKLWRKEIEEACISGGEVGVELARDPRYKENLEVKEVDLEKESLTWKDISLINNIVTTILRECKNGILLYDTEKDFNKEILKRFKAQRGEEV